MSRINKIKNSLPYISLFTILILVLVISAMIGINKTNEIKIENLQAHIKDANEMLVSMDSRNEILELENVELSNALEYYNNLKPNFNPNDITQPSFISGEQMEMILPKGLEGLGNTYVQIEYEYGINALFLYSLSGLESAYGTSKLAKERHNITSFMAYDGMVDTHSKYFDSKSECLIITANMLARDYLSEDGKYYNGLSVKDINKKYARDTQWSNKITNIAENSIDELMIVCYDK